MGRMKKAALLAAMLALGIGTMPQDALANTAVSGTSANDASIPASASGSGAVAVGDNSEATHMLSVAVGYGAKAGGTDEPKREGEITGGTTAIGPYASAQGNYSVALGVNAETTTTGYKGVAIGNQVVVSGDSAIGIGQHSVVGGEETIAIGYNVVTYKVTQAEGEEDVTKTPVDLATGIGSRSTASGIQSVAYGYASNAAEDYNSAVGSYSQATGTQAQAFGYYAQATNTGSLATGFNAQAKGEFASAFGYSSQATGEQSVAVGIQTQATAFASTAIGGQSQAKAKAASAFGYTSMATAEGATSLGYGSVARAKMSTALGTSATVYDNMENSTALGYNAQAKSKNATAIGANSVASAENTVSFGHISTDTYYKYDETTKTTTEVSYGSNSFATLVNVKGGTKKNEAATWDQLISGVSYDATSGTLTLSTNTAGTSYSTVISGGGSGDGKTYQAGAGIEITNPTSTTPTISVKADGKVEKGNDGIVTGGKVYDAMQSMNNQAIQLSNDINKVGAGAAALAALRPEGFNPGDRWSFAVGYGHYKNANAGALGVFYKPNEDMTVSFGGTIGNGDSMMNAGVSFKLGTKGKNAGAYRSMLDVIQRMDALDAKIAKETKRNDMQDAQMASQAKEIESLRADSSLQAQKIAQLAADIARMQQQLASLLSDSVMAIR